MLRLLHQLLFILFVVAASSDMANASPLLKTFDIAMALYFLRTLDNGLPGVARKRKASEP